MIKVLLASDNHGDMYSLNRILLKENDCDYYIHTGDSMMLPNEIRPFISVKGNNDYIQDYPDHRILEIDGHRIYITHGHKQIRNSFEVLAAVASNFQCDVCFYGHTHIFDDCYVNGIRMINAGSTYHNRDGNAPCYAIICFEKGKIICEKRAV